MSAATAVARHRLASTTADRLVAAVAPVLEPLENRVLFAAGDLDPLFNGGGMTLRDFTTRNDIGTAVAVQADGKVLVAGYVSSGSSLFGNDVAVVRFNADGSLDTTFGGGDGIVTTDLGSNADVARGIAVQSDGRIVVAGQVKVGTGSSDLVVLRYTADGVLDASFGTGGMTQTDLLGGSPDKVAALTLTADGRIVVAGSTLVGGYDEFALVRYTSAGHLDASFGDGGVVHTAFDGGIAQARAVAALADGSVVVAGTYTSLTDYGSDFAAVRYHATGAVDASFGTNGFVVVHLGGDYESANAVVVMGDGRVVLAGETYDSWTDTQDLGVVRLTAGGQLDTGFGGGAGYVRTDVAGGYDSAVGVHVMTDGSVVVAGSATVENQSRFALARYRSDGTLDAAFGDAGRVVYAVGTGIAVAGGLAVDGQGRLVVAGYADGAAGYDVAVIRVLNPAPNVAPTAHPGGPYTVESGSSIVLDGTGSADVDGSIVSYEWDFDYDGGSFDVDGTGSTTTYVAGGVSGTTVRTIALRVTDDAGAVHVMTTTVTITVPPPPPPPPPPVEGTAKLVDDPLNVGRKMLAVVGTSGADTIKVKEVKGGKVEVWLGDALLGTFAGMSRITIDGGDGNDVLDARKSPVAVSLNGGAGDDKLFGSDFSDVLIGGPGRDVIQGGKGLDLEVDDDAAARGPMARAMKELEKLLNRLDKRR